MPLTFYTNNKGVIQPFAIVKRDGTTVKDLTGLTITWTFEDRDGNTLTAISCVVTNAALGLCQATIPASRFTAVDKYRCQLHMTDGADYTEDTRYFWTIIEESNG